MKIALLLRGISQNKSYKHPTGKNLCIEYNKCINNYYEYLFENNSIDIFYHTYLNQDLNINELNMLLSPKAYTITFDYDTNNLQPNNKFASYSSSTIFVINLFIDYLTKNPNLKYDYIVMTRFDLIFKIPLSKLNLVKNKFMITCLAGHNLMDDNFFIGNLDHYKKFLNVLCKKNNDTMIHSDYKLLCEEIGQNNIHFLFDGIYQIFNGTPLYNILRNYITLDIFDKNSFIVIFNNIYNKFLAINNNIPFLKTNPIKYKLIKKKQFYNIITFNNSHILCVDHKNNILKFFTYVEKKIYKTFDLHIIKINSRSYQLMNNGSNIIYTDKLTWSSNNDHNNWDIFVTNDI